MPSAIQIINYKNISSSSILLYWDPPEYPNGKITHYTIYAMELDTNRAFQMTTVDNSFLITGRKNNCITFHSYSNGKYASFHKLNISGHMMYHSKLSYSRFPRMALKTRGEITD